ncbi:MAG: menaquinone biosynthesis decarboxylase [Bacteroidales bacterium]
MAYSHLFEFIEILKSHNELIVCDTPVSTDLEITEIADRFSKQPAESNKALLFTHTETEFPVLINAFGSEKRMALALGVSQLDDIRLRIDELFAQVLSSKKNMWEKLKMLPLLNEMASWMPATSQSRGVCQEIIHTSPDLLKLPVLQCWPFDGGKFITLPMVITHHPETGVRNVGMYRMQVFDTQSTGMHWHRHKTGANHYNAYKKLGAVMPISVAIGGDPAHTFSATAPLPENIDEFMLSGFLRKKKVRLVKSITNDIYVPEDADFIIEGYIDPNEEKVIEGPFGDHTGFYSLPDYYPQFHVTCITHRKKAVYPTTIVGVPPMEDAWIGKASERIFLSPIKFLLVPEIIDYSMPFMGVAHNLIIVQINKSFPGQALKVMNTLWGAGQMMFNKVLVVVDESCNIHNFANVIAAILSHTTVSHDVHILKGPLDVLDHAAPHTGFGSKLCIDATQKLPEEKYGVPQNQQYACIPIQESEYLSRTEIADAYYAKHTDVSFLVLYDADIPADDVDILLWHVLNNIDPDRDCVRNENYIVLDGTTKRNDITDRDWPTVVLSHEETIAMVHNKWKSYGLGTFLESPSAQYNYLRKKSSAWLYTQ